MNKTEAEKKEKAEERKGNFKWFAKFLLAWIALSIVPLIVITEAYYYFEAFWVTIVISLVVGFPGTVIALRIYDGRKK